MTITERLPGLPALICALSEQLGVPGVVVGVLQGEETEVFVHGTANVATGLPVTPDTAFQIGSNTKLYTATAAMRLVDEGKVDLDASVTDYVPEFHLDRGDAKAVTVRHLLTHTAGFRGDFIGTTELDHGAESTARYVEQLAGVDVIHEPGERWSYCNSGFVLLGRVVECVTGQPYDRALRSLVLDPIGDTSTRFRPEQMVPMRVAVGHVNDPETGELVVGPFGTSAHMAAAGSVAVSTAADVLRFLRMHLDGGVALDGSRVLTGETAALMQQPQVACVPAGRKDRWGLGWMLGTLTDGQRTIGHGGSAAAQVSALEVVPDQRVAVVVLTNAAGGGALGPKVVDHVLQALVGAVTSDPVVIPEEPPALDLSLYAGTYADEGLQVDVAVGGPGLMLTMTVAPLPGYPEVPQMTVPLVPIDAEAFAIPIPGGETVLRFCDLDATGRPRFFFSGRLHPRRS
jgi:CubicO group peptidase (beta-lactamase class C family)